MKALEVSDKGLETIAAHWLHLWAECVRQREDGEASASLYCRNSVSKGEFKPVNDPPPMFFVFAQVELMLGDESGPRWQFAHHVWVRNLSPGDFRHPNVKAESRSQLFRLRQAIIKQLARAIGDQKKIPVTVDLVRHARQDLRGVRAA